MELSELESDFIRFLKQKYEETKQNLFYIPDCGPYIDKMQYLMKSLSEKGFIEVDEKYTAASISLTEKAWL